MYSRTVVKSLITGTLALFCSCIENDLVDPGRGALPPSDPPSLEDEFQTDIVNFGFQPVDILFVIDDSSSMGDDQSKLASFAPEFVSSLMYDDVQYHIGSTTTSCIEKESCGNVTWIGYETVTDITGELVPLVVRGMNGYFEEMGTASLLASFKKSEGNNAGFLREGIPLHVILISDEPDSSPLRIVNKAIFRELDEVFLLREGSSLTVIVENNPPPHVSPCAALWAPSYVNLAKEYSGTVVNICDDWSEAIDTLSSSFRKRSSDFPLSRVPVSDTIEVLVQVSNATVVPDQGNWSFIPNVNSIRFTDFPLETIETVTVNYQVAM